jgi:Rrf2 family protein
MGWPSTGRVHENVDMPLLSSKFMRTLQLVLDAAVNFRRMPINGDELAGRQGYPARYFDPILTALVRARILKAARGPHGGYLFNGNPEDVTLADIEAAASSTSTKKSDTLEANPMRAEVTGPLFSALTKRWTRHLRAITIGDLCRKALRLSGKREGAAPAEPSDGQIIAFPTRDPTRPQPTGHNR